MPSGGGLEKCEEYPHHFPPHFFFFLPMAFKSCSPFLRLENCHSPFAGCIIHVELVRIIYPIPVETASECTKPAKLCDVRRRRAGFM